MKSGDLGTSLSAYRSVIARFPGNAKAQAGVRKIEALLARGSATQRQSPNQMHSAARTAEDKGDFATAIDLYEAVLRQAPGRLDVQNDLGMVLLQAGQPQRSVEVLKDLARRAPDVAEAHINLARSYVTCEMYDAAIASCEQALQVDPTHAVALCNLGSICARTGRIDRAISCYETSIAHNPTHADAYVNLVEARKLPAGDPMIARMEQVVTGDELPAVERIKLHFALGKVLDGTGDTDRAFDHYRHANDLAKRTRSFDVAQELAVLDAGREMFDRPNLPMLTLSDVDTPPVIPIFIIGMPRSGSTLIERVLSSHSQVHGAGEIGDFRRNVCARPRAARTGLTRPR